MFRLLCLIHLRMSFSALYSTPLSTSTRFDVTISRYLAMQWRHRTITYNSIKANTIQIVADRCTHSADCRLCFVRMTDSEWIHCWFTLQMQKYTTQPHAIHSHNAYFADGPILCPCQCVSVCCIVAALHVYWFVVVQFPLKTNRWFLFSLLNFTQTTRFHSVAVLSWVIESFVRYRLRGFELSFQLDIWSTQQREQEKERENLE